jgi:uncharacterized C2H2 Zn-finger protein
MAQWMFPEQLLNMDENKQTLPNTFQQEFSNTGNMSCNIDVQREIPIENIARHGLQLVLPPKSDSRRAATEGENVFRCTQCGKVYMSKGSLTRHLKFECGKEPQFQCPHCPLRTKRKSSLLTHIYCKHTGTPELP